MNNLILTPVKAIRKHCIECSCGQHSEVKKCVITTCPLYPYRMGKNPSRKGIMKGFPGKSSKCSSSSTNRKNIEL